MVLIVGFAAGGCSHSFSDSIGERNEIGVDRTEPEIGEVQPRGETVNDQAPTINELLHEAGETHHRVFRIVDGADADWASWYADWLINLSELSELLGTTPVRSELVYMLVRLDKEYSQQQRSEPWEDYYTQALAAHFAV